MPYNFTKVYIHLQKQKQEEDDMWSDVSSLKHVRTYIAITTYMIFVLQFNFSDDIMEFQAMLSSQDNEVCHRICHLNKIAAIKLSVGVCLLYV